MPDRDQLLAAALAVAPAWGLDVADIELLSLTENAVYRVAVNDGEVVVLRLHRPGYNNLAELTSELAWTEALAAAGLRVPRVRRALDGAGYVEVIVGDERRHAGVIDWIDGEPVRDLFGIDTHSISERFHQVGRAAAEIRTATERWRPPDGFTRRRWDADGLLGADPLWGRFWEAAALDAPTRDLFSRARATLYERLSDLPTDPSRFGLIHADLHLGNVMAHGDHVTTIDFDDAGFGWHAYELAVALQPGWDEPWFEESRSAIVAGYRSRHELSSADVELLPAFMALRSLILVGWLDARPEVLRQVGAAVVVDPATIAAEELLARR